jgi:hypothetical protein
MLTANKGQTILRMVSSSKVSFCLVRLRTYLSLIGAALRKESRRIWLAVQHEGLEK